MDFVSRFLTELSSRMAGRSAEEQQAALIQISTALHGMLKAREAGEGPTPQEDARRYTRLAEEEGPMFDGYLAADALTEIFSAAVGAEDAANHLMELGRTKRIRLPAGPRPPRYEAALLLQRLRRDIDEAVDRVIDALLDRGGAA